MRSSPAFTLIEILTALMLLGLAGIGLSMYASDVSRDAAHVAQRLRIARMTWVVAGGTDNGTACVRPIDGIRARVVNWPTRGLLFTPDGLPRTCDGGGVGNTTILLEYRGRQAAVIVSSLGRVRWEMR